MAGNAGSSLAESSLQVSLYINHDDDDDGLPAYSHQSYSQQVRICHYDEGWENDTVTFPP